MLDRMFMQLVFGKVSDAESVRREWGRWMSDLAPGAAGWLDAPPSGDSIGEVSYRETRIVGPWRLACQTRGK